MKQQLAKSVALSFLSPLLTGCVLGIYFTISSHGAGVGVFLSLLTGAIVNAHIVGLSMALFVVPGYLLLFRVNKVHYSAILTLGMLGGAISSYLFAAQSGAGLVVNSIMATMAAGLFLYGLRRFA
ncbi:hypothetical protein [Pseudoalteromonas byunsanensis]|uniref:Lipoprotein n=1 Tax=Pseudoalteromonas byunsanensis TaxID=327939 RepID=A0A1S1NBC3_9GAMM|nr:hypothetical protein [Pseudoalteromonas byunsanensis]OHU96714.1 hypothetical protein BIW53_05140 [Pseudoalteromonas byunsanensis]